MLRFWILFGVLGIGDLLLAGALALTMPMPVAIQPPVADRDLRPFFTISANPRSFDNRVRTIVRGEFQQIGALSPVSPIGALAPGDRPGLPGQLDREEGRRGPQQSAPIRATTAMLTPFGLYQSGPIGIGLAFLSLAALLSIGAATVYLFPDRLRVLRDTLTVPLGRRFNLGFIGLLGYLICLLLLLILVTLVVGLPVAAVLLTLLTATTVLGWVAVGLVCGRWLSDRLALPVSTPLADLAIGLLLLFPLGLIPWLGWILVAALASLGFGAVLVTKFGSPEGWSLEPLS